MIALFLIVVLCLFVFAPKKKVEEVAVEIEETPVKIVGDALLHIVIMLVCIAGIIAFVGAIAPLGQLP
jgi:hypothetical protein